MFTGIVEELGELLSQRHYSSSAHLVIKGKKILSGLEIGESISVNGVCLTVSQVHASAFSADVMPETLRNTDLSNLTAGSRVNLERALAVGERLGGHFVSGHIDGTGEISQITREGNALVIKFTAPVSILRYLVPKGSVAVDGISLTVVELNKEGFSVSLIPHTAESTTLGYKKRGDTVNLEADMLMKYLERLLMHRPDNLNKIDFQEDSEENTLTYSLLKEKGFL